MFVLDWTRFAAVSPEEAVEALRALWAQAAEVAPRPVDRAKDFDYRLLSDGVNQVVCTASTRSAGDP
eukprot:COSAG05_NODE_573_length_8601_cov_58.330981_1_plen_67_part_00